jgi:hypothetical protein
MDFKPKRVIKVDKYLHELSNKYTTDTVNVSYTHAVTDGGGTKFNLVIYKTEQEYTKKTITKVFEGRMTPIKNRIDTYYVNFVKQKIRILIYFFM